MSLEVRSATSRSASEEGSQVPLPNGNAQTGLAQTDTVKMHDDGRLAALAADEPEEAPKRTFSLQSLFWVMQIATALAAGFWLAKQSNGPDNRLELARAPINTSNIGGVPVTVDRMVVRNVERAIEAVGNLNGYDELTLKTKVSGRVAKLHHDFADKVKPGELLLEIDPTDATLAVEQSKRSLNSELAKWGFQSVPDDKVDLTKLPTVTSARLKADWSKSQLERLQTLQARGSVIAEEIEQARTNALVAESDYSNQLLMARAGAATAQLKKAELDIAQQQLQETQVYLPLVRDIPPELRYTITDRYVATGAWLAAGTDLFRLVIDEKLKLRLTVPEKYSGQVSLGQAVEVGTIGQSQPAQGTVTRIGPAVDPSTRTFQVEAEVPNASGVLKTGSFAKARVLIASASAQTVPVAALVTFAGVHKIFIVNGDQVKEVQVTLGQQTADWVEIAKPTLPENTVVVTSGQSRLADGSMIRLRSAEEAKPDAETARRNSAGPQTTSNSTEVESRVEGAAKAQGAGQ